MEKFRNRNSDGVQKKIDPFKKTEFETTAVSALKQIKDKQYAQKLLDLGIHRIGKEVLIQHKLTNH